MRVKVWKQGDRIVISQSEEPELTKAEALTADALHSNGCSVTVGPRGGFETHIYIVRRNGQTQTWKTRENEFRIPVKHGFRTTGQIYHYNTGDWHTSENCRVGRLFNETIQRYAEDRRRTGADFFVE